MPSLVKGVLGTQRWVAESYGQEVQPQAAPPAPPKRSRAVLMAGWAVG